jgi:anti-sigma B factor antagonist
MSLQAYTRMDRGVAVIELDGKITLGDGSSLLRDTLNQAITDGHKSILLDLEGVSYIDSAGLGELVGCNSLAKVHGATIRLVHLQKKIQGLLQITKLITMFDTFNDEDAAVRSFDRASSAQL